MVIEGEAGIGKSTLAERVADQARARGFRTATARGTELERQYAYGTAIRLFEPLVVATPKAMLRGPAASAAALFQRPDSAPARADAFTTIHALFWLCVNATDAGPLLLVVDDAQWADDASLRFLHYLAQRLPELPVTCVATFRSTEPETEEPAAAGVRLDPGALRLAPSPLTEAGVAALLGMVDADADAAAARDTWAATRGNPFLVAELVRQRRSEGSVGRGRPGDVPVPEAVARFVHRRIRRLDPTARRVAETIAVLGDHGTARRAARLAGVSDPEALDALERLASAAIVEGSRRIGFVHPLVRAAVYEAIPAVIRARDHREAGLLLDMEHEPLGAVASQLLSAERCADPRVVDLLLRAGREALGRGEPGVAGTLAARALEEPPDPAGRIAALRLLGQAEASLGSPQAAKRYAEALTHVGDDAVEQARILLELGHALMGQGDVGGAAAAFDRGRLAVGDRDAELRGALQVGFLSASWVGMERSDEVAGALATILAAPSLGRGNRELATWTAFHQAMASVTRFEEPLALVRRVLDEAPVDALITEGQLIELAAGVLVTTDELALEIDLLTRALEAAQAAGAYARVAIFAYCRGWPTYYSGRVTDAIADTQAALAASELGWQTFVPATRAVLALGLLEREQLDAAAAAATLEGTGWQRRIDASLIPIAQGRIALARGDAARAVELLRTAAAGPTSVGMRSPVLGEWRNWLCVALARQGQRDEAIALADEAVGITTTWGARWPQGAALRAAGIARGGESGLELLRQSVAFLETGPARLELARSLAELGAALRRQGYRVAAREALSRGMDEAFRAGAVAILRQCREELRAAGARPRRLAMSGAAALTPSEARVARLAAAGRTNRQIAEALFVTPKTVEYHLANAFAKLGVDSRTGLGGALGDEPGDGRLTGA